MNDNNHKASSEPSAKVNFIYNSIYQIVAILIPLVTTPYISRKLGANGLGEYAMELAVASYFIMFIKLGINNYGGRQIAYSRGNKEVTSREFWEMYAFQIVMMAACGVAYVFYCFFISGHKTISLILILYVVSAGIDITWFFWGLEEFKLTVRRDFIVKIFSTICIFAFVNSETDTWKYTLLLSISFFLSQALLWPSLKKHIDFVRPSKKGIIRHIKPNLVLFVPTIAISLYKTMDKIMLGAMSNTVEVGFYQSSENVIQIPMSLILSLGTVMQPRMANLISRNSDEKNIEKIFSISISLVMFLSTSIGFGIMTVSREFVPLFYGQGFEKCILLFQILLPSCIFLAFANVIRTQYLIPRKKDKEYIISLFSGAAVNLLFNSILIPIIQSAGAAIGTFLAEMTVCLVQAILVRKELNSAQYFIQSMPFIISGSLMYFIWRLIDVTFFDNQIISLFTKVIAGGITYLLILLLLILIWNRCFKMEIDYLNILKSTRIKRSQLDTRP